TGCLVGDVIDVSHDALELGLPGVDHRGLALRAEAEQPLGADLDEDRHPAEDQQAGQEDRGSMAAQPGAVELLLVVGVDARVVAAPGWVLDPHDDLATAVELTCRDTGRSPSSRRSKIRCTCPSALTVTSDRSCRTTMFTLESTKEPLSAWAAMLARARPVASAGSSWTRPRRAASRSRPAAPASDAESARPARAWRSEKTRHRSRLTPPRTSSRRQSPRSQMV